MRPPIRADPLMTCLSPRVSCCPALAFSLPVSLAIVYSAVEARLDHSLWNQYRSTAMTILVIDDDAGIRELLTIFLSFKGYSALAVANGAEALAYLQQTALPQLILLDLTMPVM